MFTDPLSNLTQLGIAPGMKVADLGAGSGFYSINAARLATGSGHVYSIDIQKDLLDRLKKEALDKHITNLEVIWGDVERIGGTKVRDMSVDRVVISNILFQLEHKNDMCLEVKRILKPDGKILVVDWAIGSPIGPVTFVNKYDARSLFERSGFIFEKEIMAGDHHYGLIFRKQ